MQIVERTEVAKNVYKIVIENGKDTHIIFVHKNEYTTISGYPFKNTLMYITLRNYYGVDPPPSYNSVKDKIVREYTQITYTQLHNYKRKITYGDISVVIYIYDDGFILIEGTKQFIGSLSLLDRIDLNNSAEIPILKILMKPVSKTALLAADKLAKITPFLLFE